MTRRPRLKGHKVRKLKVSIDAATDAAVCALVARTGLGYSTAFCALASSAALKDHGLANAMMAVFRQPEDEMSTLLDGVIVTDIYATGESELRHRECVGPAEIIEGQSPSPNAEPNGGEMDQRCGACGEDIPWLVDNGARPV